MRKIVAGNWKMNGTRENLVEIKKYLTDFLGLM
jgi:triosephosphate isomerase